MIVSAPRKGDRVPRLIAPGEKIVSDGNLYINHIADKKCKKEKFMIYDTVSLNGSIISHVCPFWKGTYILSCKADKRAYYPSQFEIKEYCDTKRFRFCPVYKKTDERTYHT